MAKAFLIKNSLEKKLGAYIDRLNNKIYFIHVAVRTIIREPEDVSMNANIIKRELEGDFRQFICFYSPL